MFNVVMIVVDSVLKKAYFIPTYIIVTMKGIARLFVLYLKLHSFTIINRQIEYINQKLI